MEKYREIADRMVVQGPLPIKFIVYRVDRMTIEALGMMTTTDRDDPSRSTEVHYKKKIILPELLKPGELRRELIRIARELWSHELWEQFLDGDQRVWDPHVKEGEPPP